MGPDGVDLRPRLLQQFIVLAETGDIDEAAERLGSSASALRKAMQRLERQLGTRLFVHDSRTVRLTTDGAGLVRPAARVVSAAARFTAGVRSLSGTLRVAHASSVDTLSLILDRYTELHPEIEVDEQVLTCDAQIEALREREIDVAVCRVTGAAPSDCQVQLLRLDPVLAAVAGPAGASAISVDPVRTPMFVGETGGEWPARDELITSFERAAGCRLQRVRVLTAAGQHVAALERTHAPAFLVLSSFTPRPAERRLAGLVPLQPYFPWSLVWPTEAAPAVAAFAAAARAVGAENDWLATDKLPGMPWLPEDDVHHDRLRTSQPPDETIAARVSAIGQVRPSPATASLRVPPPRGTAP